MPPHPRSPEAHPPPPAIQVTPSVEGKPSPLPIPTPVTTVLHQVRQAPRERRSPNKIERPALREWNASGRAPQMVGDGMVGSSGDVNQGTTVGGEERACRGQSVRSSWEAGNDRGARGRRKVVVGPGRGYSHGGSDSAARLSVRMHRRTGLKLRLVRCLRAPRVECLSQSNERPLTGKPDAGEPPVRFGRAGEWTTTPPTLIVCL